MKRSVLWTVVALAFFFGAVCSKIPINGVPAIGVVLYAQSVPTTATVFWNPNAATENIVSYQLTIDGGTPITVLPTACTGTPVQCVASVSYATFGAHPTCVAAVNLDLGGDPTVTGSPRTGQSKCASVVVNPLASPPTGVGAHR